MVYADIDCSCAVNEISTQGEDARQNPMSRPMTPRDLLTTFVTRWPAAVLVFGLVLTLVWVALLVGFPLYLLRVI